MVCFSFNKCKFSLYLNKVFSSISFINSFTVMLYYYYSCYKYIFFFNKKQKTNKKQTDRTFYCMDESIFCLICNYKIIACSFITMYIMPLVSPFSVARQTCLLTRPPILTRTSQINCSSRTVESITYGIKRACPFHDPRPYGGFRGMAKVYE